MAATLEPESQSLDLDTDHRRLFRENPEQDSGTDQDDLAEDSIGVQLPYSDPPPELDVLGFSISRVQTELRSPRTPAAEKFRAIEDSEDYFRDEAVDEGVDGRQGTSPSLATARKHPSQTASPKKAPSPPVQPWSSSHPQTGRSSMMRSILGDTDSNRRRSNSGPTMFGAFKKMLPDMPSVPLLKSNQGLVGKHFAAIPKVGGANEFTSKEITDANRESSRDNGSMTQQHIARQASTTSPLGLDGNVESVLSPTSPKPNTLLVRSNSDGSLYLKRQPTAASAFDDTSAFADVSEMHNARFKAITDSFQNSTLKMPKLPTIRHGAKRASTPPDGVDETTQQNTQANTRDSSQNNAYYYTNLKNIRNPKKPIEVESAQQRAHPVLSEALAKLTGDLVILGGYRGSILRDARPPHRQLWAPVKVGLGLRDADLEVGLTRGEEEHAHKKVFSSGVLSHIGPIDICRRLLKHTRKCPNARHNRLRIHDYGYDWRLSPDLLGERLIRFLESLNCNEPGTPREKRGATIIAHSLGGLITRWAINRRPELFAGVVYAGAPHQCVNILGPMRNGDDVLLSSKVLTAQVNFTLRTSYVLLPENGRCFVNKHTNERYDVDFFDVRTWEEYCLSPCIKLAIAPIVKEPRKSIMDSISDSIVDSLPSMPSMPSVTSKSGSWFGGIANPFASQNGRADSAQEEMPAHSPPAAAGEVTLEPTMKTGSSTFFGKPSIATACNIPLPIAKEYLTRTLSEVLAFKNALAHKPELQSSNKYPPHAVIFGKSVPTVYGARVLSREHIKYTDAFDDLAFAAGDGVVLASAAQLPEGYRCVKGGRVETDRGHVGLLGDLEGVGQCLSALIEARERGVGMGCYEAE